MMQGLLWPLLGMLICMAGGCAVVMAVMARVGHRSTSPDPVSTGGDDVGRTR
jgi:hypothetical protein